MIIMKDVGEWISQFGTNASRFPIKVALISEAEEEIGFSLFSFDLCLHMFPLKKISF